MGKSLSKNNYFLSLKVSPLRSSIVTEGKTVIIKYKTLADNTLASDQAQYHC